MKFNFFLKNHEMGGVAMLEDALRPMAAGMIEGGHQVQFEYTHLLPRPYVNLVLEHFPGPGLLNDMMAAKEKFGDDLIIGLVATEDLSDSLSLGKVGDRPRVTNLLRSLPFFDFVWLLMADQQYDVELTKAGATNKAHFLAFGHCPSLQAQPAEDQTIDILLYGKFTPHRAPPIHQLLKQGVRVQATFGDMPEYIRHNMISRSKIVLDMRRGPVVRFLSASRITAALHYGSLVVAEDFDTSIMGKLADYTLRTPYERLAERCLEILALPDTERLGMAQQLRDKFAAETSMRRNIDALLPTIPY
ncbi:hypothetical protein A6A04_10535 [Paramagnetospirillum marisnigri]|uniref:Glycosyltransferase n=1 Tax=Paramagnetospirillum marisnigri TaxID=1285242 RepID=A0A178MX86_9PROT|nr:hypothetical protein [Paramagnetospirillum marisnigri]OAN55988.1 hypothetical protein A6A04_10535 [Paramagnetospirillum marisnigri]